MYMKVFKGIWVATAFKGASGPNVQLPMISMHLDCQERWLQELQIQHDRGTLPKIRGLALTGWSRYTIDHTYINLVTVYVFLLSALFIIIVKSFFNYNLGWKLIASNLNTGTTIML